MFLKKSFALTLVSLVISSTSVQAKPKFTMGCGLTAQKQQPSTEEVAECVNEMTLPKTSDQTLNAVTVSKHHKGLWYFKDSSEEIQQSSYSSSFSNVLPISKQLENAGCTYSKDNGQYRYAILLCPTNAVTITQINNPQETNTLMATVKCSRGSECMNKLASETQSQRRSLSPTGVYTASYLRLGNSIADYNQALKLHPSNAEAYYKQGLAYYETKEYDRAIAEYNQALKLDPSYAHAYYDRGNAYLDKKEYDRAIADYNQVLKLDPSYADAYNDRGNAYLDKKEYDRAIADYNQVLKLDPSYAHAYNNRGNAYFHKKEYDRAIADINQALKLDPSDAHVYDSRCEAYDDKGDYDRAITDCDQAIKLSPNFSDAYYNRGNAYKNKGRKDKAQEDFKKVLELNDDVELSQKAQEQIQILCCKNGRV